MKRKCFIYMLLIWILTGPNLWSQTGNPFEIIRSQSNQKADTTQTYASETSERQETRTLDSNSAQDSLGSVNLDKNPFEVSHIPIIKKRRVVKQTIKPTNSKVYNFDSVFKWLIVLNCLIFAVVISLNRSMVLKLLTSIINQNLVRSLRADLREGFSLLSGILFFIFVCSLWIVSALALRSHGTVISVKMFYLLPLIISGIYIFKHIVLSIAGNIFPFRKLMRAYNFGVFCINMSLGIFLIPINLLMIFGSSNMLEGLLFFAMALILIFYLYRLLRALLLGIVYLVSHPFHFFMYLCALEILPILIAVKLLVNIGWISL